MVFEDIGFQELQAKGIRNEGGETPTYLTFAGSDNTYTGTETLLNDEIIRVSVTWTETGNNSKFKGIVTSTEGNGSYFGAAGLQYGDVTGSGVLFTASRSFVGNKDNTFNVQLEGEVIMRRPNV